MKVLYVEDETSNLCKYIRQLFGDFLTEDEKTKLEHCKNHSWDGLEHVKELFANHPCITVEYDFLSALKLIETGEMEAYDIFIFDRNLGISDTDFEENCMDFFSFTPSELTYIRNGGLYGREGDFLLKRLHIKLNDKIKGKVYFLSAYPSADVFGDNEVLRDIVQQNKLLTEDNYISKGDPNGETRLKDIVNAIDNEEERLLYKKWGKVLSYYDKFHEGYKFRRKIVSALTSDSIISSKLLSEQELQDLYCHIVEDLDNFHKNHFYDDIFAQKQALENDWNAALQKARSKQQRISQKKFENKWYKTAKISRNIIEISEIIPQTRNNCVHQRNQKHINEVCGVDVCGLSVLACAYALLEITRFWQDCEEKDKENKS